MLFNLHMHSLEYSAIKTFKLKAYLQRLDTVTISESGGCTRGVHVTNEVNGAKTLA